MKIKDLMNMTLKEILKDYALVFNPECCYYYGFASYDLLDELYEEYNIVEDYPEAFTVESVISEDLIYDDDEELMDYQKLEKIMSDLDISKK